MANKGQEVLHLVPGKDRGHSLFVASPRMQHPPAADEGLDQGRRWNFDSRCHMHSFGDANLHKQLDQVF
jgi:hypothetical protein